MIRRLGSHTGKRVYFGYDRYLASELDSYVAVLSQFGDVVQAVEVGRLHYLTSAELVCRSLQNDPDAFGVLCCGTGMGMSIAANKFNGIYAARCTSAEDAELARTINNSNVVCIASKQGLAINTAILSTFATTSYTGRKLEELEYITTFEQTPFVAAPAASIAAGPRTLRRSA
ncbi:MAG TPA: RpiB/LacA/LacB family sugar-phosphate isomerase [Kofleriaceae bacterium]|jgi:RpiB/LacA/LacB family sugar-phosphate isomerase